jgi:hypothetical protein
MFITLSSNFRLHHSATMYRRHMLCPIICKMSDLKMSDMLQLVVEIEKSSPSTLSSPSPSRFDHDKLKQFGHFSKHIEHRG